MPLPRINATGVVTLIPAASDVSDIGSGGQKRVFKARLGTKYEALKFLLLVSDEGPEDGDLGSVEARADREVTIMRDCPSPYMVKLGSIDLEIGELNGQQILFFSEELIEGPSLAEIVALEALDVPSTIDLGLQVGDALKELSGMGKVHRDVKPGNIMRRKDGSFVLLDAGLAFDSSGESLSAGVVGTFAYCSPEQFDYSNRRALDVRSDQFSLGVTMYYACTGQHPFKRQGVNDSQIFSAIMNHQPPPPSELNSDIPPELDDIIGRMLGKSPHLRYRRMEQLLKALEVLKG